MSLTDDFKTALSAWASGVSVVTTNSGGRIYGLTVSSFSSLSLDPPLILVCLHNENRLPAMIAQAGGFAVSILCRKQEAASNYFAKSGREATTDFTEIDGEWTPSGQPIIARALATIVCELQDQLPQGDHTIVVGRVIQASASDDGEPLLYYRREYRGIADSA
jgi:flavin reductase (DIM6/NTAB) family NADH-FMN oxidoreductase RutF